MVVKLGYFFAKYTNYLFVSRLEEEKYEEI